MLTPLGTSTLNHKAYSPCAIILANILGSHVRMRYHRGGSLRLGGGWARERGSGRGRRDWARSGGVTPKRRPAHRARPTLCVTQNLTDPKKAYALKTYLDKTSFCNLQCFKTVLDMSRNWF